MCFKIYVLRELGQNCLCLYQDDVQRGGERRRGEDAALRAALHHLPRALRARRRRLDARNHVLHDEYVYPEYFRACTCAETHCPFLERMFHAS